jgi:hypothetical protein
MDAVQTYSQIVKDLRLDYPKLSDFEVLNVAIQLQRNQILQAGLNVSNRDNHPSALEAIAICLGYTNNQFKQTITEVLQERNS